MEIMQNAIQRFSASENEVHFFPVLYGLHMTL
jgi:hypothetical protein